MSSAPRPRTAPALVPVVLLAAVVTGGCRGEVGPGPTDGSADRGDAGAEDSDAPADAGTTDAAADDASDGDGGGGADLPLGIPAPPFGLDERHTMYAGRTYAAGGFAYRDAGDGPYTHYVRADDPSCSDDEPYGTPEAPRCTIPGSEGSPLEAGSVVEVHGRYDVDHTSPRDFHAEGTAEAPVFVRGPSTGPRPVFTGPFEVIGSRYLVVENVEFADRDGDLTGGSVGTFAITDKNGARYDSHHCVLRWSDVHGNLEGGGVAVASYGGSELTYNVLYANTIHDNGDVTADYDQDVHGIATNAQYLWVLGNDLRANSGDGLQINGTRETTHHLYVGRNVSHGNKQTGMWTKTAADVIFSENYVYAHRAGNSSGGACMGFQYDPERVWFLFNELRDCDVGIGSGGGDAGDATDGYYVVGNLIYDIHATGGPEPDNGAWTAGGAIQLTDDAGGTHRTIVHNTIFDADAGILVPRGEGAVTILNNVLAEIALEHVYLDVDPTGSVLDHTLFDPLARVRWGASVTDVAGLQARAAPVCGQCVEADAEFIAPAAADFRVAATSLAVDRGADAEVYDVFYARYGLDIAVARDGTPRPVGSRVDLGAYER